MARALVLVLILTHLVGCNAPADDDDSTAGTEEYVPECAPPGASVCDNEGSILRGVVRVPEEVLLTSETRGSLVLTLTHLRFGGGDAGGAFHAQTVLNDVDLADGPVPFELDMCDGGAMYSEENCEFNLLAVLDTNGNNTTTLLPDEGEIAGRVADINLSCHRESPCLDVVMGCTDGATCVTFEDPDDVCACPEESCPSIFSVCE